LNIKMIVVALMIIVLVTSIAIPQADAKKHNSKLLREFEKKIQEATADDNTVNKNHNKTGGALKKFEQKLAEGVGNTTQQTKTENLSNDKIGYDNSTLSITNVSIKYGIEGSPVILGLLQNTGEDTIKGVKLSIQLYDKDNHLVGVVSSFPESTESNNLLPNDTTAFKIDGNDETIKNVDHVSIKVMSNKSDK